MSIDPNDALRPGDAVVVVDMQNDFCPGGALPIEQGDEVVPILNAWIDAAAAKHLPVFVSRDWHPVNHSSFEAQGGPWPPHCVQDTDGAAFHPDLHVPESAIKITKGVRFDQDQYSAFDQTGLLELMTSMGVQRVWVGGLAQDVCVKATALDARAGGLEVRLIPGATRPVTRDGGREALEEMEKAGVAIALE